MHLHVFVISHAAAVLIPARLPQTYHHRLCGDMSVTAATKKTLLYANMFAEWQGHTLLLQCPCNAMCRHAGSAAGPHFVTISLLQCPVYRYVRAFAYTMAKKHQQRTDKKDHLNSQPHICAPVASAAMLSQPRKKKSHLKSQTYACILNAPALIVAAATFTQHHAPIVTRPSEETKHPWV